MVAVLAGRRVDAADATPARFPLDRVGAVRAELRQLLDRLDARVLVAAAACGADLIGLEEAQKRHMETRIVLPFAPTRFRESSVIDRPGGWGPIFDRALAGAASVRDEQLDPDDEATYLAGNEAILRVAEKLREPGEPAVAIVVWNGESRGPGDVTEAFLNSARAKGYAIEEVRTIA